MYTGQDIYTYILQFLSTVYMQTTITNNNNNNKQNTSLIYSKYSLLRVEQQNGFFENNPFTRSQSQLICGCYEKLVC